MKNRFLALMLGLIVTLATAHAEAPSIVLSCVSTDSKTELKIGVYFHVGRIGHSPIGAPTVYTLIARDRGSAKKVFHLMQVSRKGMIEKLVAMEREDIVVKMDTSQLLAQVKFGQSIQARCSVGEGNL